MTYTTSSGMVDDGGETPSVDQNYAGQVGTILFVASPGDGKPQQLISRTNSRLRQHRRSGRGPPGHRTKFKSRTGAVKKPRRHHRWRGFLARPAALPTERVGDEDGVVALGAG